MSQNSQINTEINQLFFNNEFEIDQPSSNILYNDITATNNNSLPVRYTTTPMTHVDLTSQNYETVETQYNNSSTEQVLTQNPPRSFSSSLNILPPHMDTFNFSPEIIIREIPGYDVIYIPKPNPFDSNINSNMQQDSNFLNPSPVISMQQQSYVSSVNGISAGESPANPIIIDP